jgi:uncharacterized membrane protein
MRHMPEDNQELEELRRRIAELTQRIYRLEQASGTAAAPARAVAPPAPPAPASTPSVPFATVPPAAAAPPNDDEDLEVRIGSQWLNRIGVFALLIGAAYFLKLAFDNGWIGPSGRVAIGLIAGIVLVAFSSRLHAKGMRYFAYSLAATGIGVMYLSLWAAFQLYHLVPAPVAFIAMVIVTASAGWLALRLDAQILAAVAIAGGFATPALLSTGENRPHVLFPYFLILNAVTIALVTMRPWRRLLAGSFLATTIYYFAWHASFFTKEQTWTAVVYASAFFLMWAVLPLLRRLHVENGNDVGWGASRTFVTVALMNPVVFFLQLWMTYQDQDNYRTTLAWAAVALGAFYIFLANNSRPVKHRPDEVVVPFTQWLHLAIALAFLTIAIPLKLEAHWITMAWFVESAILLFIGRKLDHDFLKNAAVAALILGVIRLLAWDDFHPTRLIFNARMATYLLAIAVLGAITHTVREENDDESTPYIICSVALNMLALVAILGEATHYYQRVFAGAHWDYSSGAGYERWRNVVKQRDFVYSGLAMLYGFGLLAVGFWRRSAVLRWQALVLIFCTIAKVFIYDLSTLTGVLRVLSFLALGVLLMAASYIYQRDWLKLSAKAQQ